jgi:hypothetical protein
VESLYRLVWSADFNNLISYKALAVPDQLSTEHCTFKVAKDYLLLNLYTSMGTIRGLDGKIKISTNFLRFLDTVKFFDISYTERPISHLKNPAYGRHQLSGPMLIEAPIQNNPDKI